MYRGLFQIGLYLTERFTESVANLHIKNGTKRFCH